MVLLQQTQTWAVLRLGCSCVAPVPPLCIPLASLPLTPHLDVEAVPSNVKANVVLEQKIAGVMQREAAVEGPAAATREEGSAS